MNIRQYLHQEADFTPIDSGDAMGSIECNGMHVRFSGTIKATNLESSGPFGSHRFDHFDTRSETFGASQGSRNSQSTSPYSLVQGHTTPVASMAAYSEFGAATSTVSFDLANTANLSFLRAVPQPKRSHSHGIGKKHKAKRLSGKYDPENHEIMRLRQEENLDFQQIAGRLNKARCKNGGKDDLTDNAIYSRYTRNAPLIAQMRNERFVPTAKVSTISSLTEQHAYF